MAKKDRFHPYTGRSNRTRNVLIGLLLFALFCAFLTYTYRTDAEFRAAVGSLTAIFRGESSPRQTDPTTPTGPTGSGGEGLPTEPYEGQPLNMQQAHAASSGNLLYRAPEQLADPASAVELAAQSGYDGLLVDLKQSGGAVVYRSRLESGAVQQAMAPGAYDLEALAALCEERGLYLVGRLSTFADHIAPGAMPGSGVAVASGVVFLDGNYRRNLDPYRELAMEYLAALAEEAASMGVRELLLSDVAFPHYGKISLIVYGGERSKPDQLLHCIDQLRDAAAAHGAIVSVELPLNVFLDPDYAQVSGQEFAPRLSCGVVLRSGMTAELMAEPELQLLQDAVARLPEDLTRSVLLSSATLEAALPVFTQSGVERLFLVEIQP